MLDMYSIHSIDVVSIGRKRDQKGSKGGGYILFRRYQYMYIATDTMVYMLAN